MIPTVHSAARRLVRALFAASVLSTLAPPAHAERKLVDYDEAARFGLERAWFAQTPIDASRTRASSWYLYFDRVYCVTDSGLVTALNAETGAELWTRQVGRAGAPAFGPEANELYLGVVSGSRLYLLERETGRVKWSRDLGSAPSSGPALANKYAYVALVTGRVEGYQLDDPARQPWYYQSKGRTYLRPTTTGAIVSWPTAEGYLYVSRANDPGVLFRLETNNDIVTSPAEMEPYLYIASLDGYLYALHELTGREQWRYATGYPIMSSPAIVGDRAYVASIEPVLHCLDAAAGRPLWTMPGASHFGAQSKSRVYASDEYGNLLILDAQSGALVGKLPTAEGMSTIVNDQTDRIFLVNDRGLVQCLREIGAVEPTHHRQPIKAEPEGDEGGEQPADATETAPADDSAADDEPAEEGSPFEAEETPPAADDEGAADEPPAAGEETDNPFDDF